jgi:hypothetical protein
VRFEVNTPSVISERFESEVIVIHLESGAYFSLRDSAADAWNRFEAGQTLDEVTSEWSRLFPAEEGLSSDLSTFLKEILAAGLLRETTEGARPFGDSVTFTPYAAPKLETFTDMQDLLLLDPVHDVGEAGWPQEKPR